MPVKPPFIITNRSRVGIRLSQTVDSVESYLSLNVVNLQNSTVLCHAMSAYVRIPKFRGADG